MAGSGKIALNFLRHVDTHGYDESKCWEWLGAGKGNGYGHTSKGAAHRVSYEIFVGKAPAGMDVCHTCDNRCCVNPSHLFIGSRADNMNDMKLEGRGYGGARKHLREHQIQEIKRRLKAGSPMDKIARSMNVNYATVTSIARGDSYVR